MSMTVYDYNYDLAIREIGKQVAVTNGTGRTVLYGEMVYLNGYLGFVMDHAGIADAAVGRIALLDESIEFTTAQVEATDTFTVGNVVYFTPGTSLVAGEIVDAPESGSIPIGVVIASKGTGGAQTAVQVRSFGSRDGQVKKTARVVIDAATDYRTVGKVVQIPKGSYIIDVTAICTAAVANGTAQVKNGASAVHTALVMAVDGVLTRMAAAVDDTKLLVGADAITVVTTNAADAGIVLIDYI